jgi:hypothetical protein
MFSNAEHAYPACLVLCSALGKLPDSKQEFRGSLLHGKVQKFAFFKKCQHSFIDFLWENVIHLNSSCVKQFGYSLGKNWRMMEIFFGKCAFLFGVFYLCVGDIGVYVFHRRDRYLGLTFKDKMVQDDVCLKRDEVYCLCSDWHYYFPSDRFSSLLHSESV